MFQEHCFIFLYEMNTSIFPYIHWNGMDYADVRYEIPHSEYVTDITLLCVLRKAKQIDMQTKRKNQLRMQEEVFKECVKCFKGFLPSLPAINRPLMISYYYLRSLAINCCCCNCYALKNYSNYFRK